MPNKDLHIEKEVLQQIAEGDEAAFTILFHTCLRALQPFVMKFTGSVADTEEVLQETLLRLWMNRDTLPSLENPRAWIYTVTSNECLKFLRKKVLQQEKVQAIRAVSAKDDNSTQQEIQLNEVKRLVAEAVAKLPRQRRRIYQMSRNEGMKIPEIAAVLRISPNTVKNALVSSLSYIRKYLANAGHLFAWLLCLLLKK